jgi:hypothetical protein
MFELLLQTFWARKTLVKSLLISTLDKVIYYNGTFLQGTTKPLFTSQIGWRPAEKNLPVFFNMRVLDLDFYVLDLDFYVIDLDFYVLDLDFYVLDLDFYPDFYVLDLDFYGYTWFT